MTQPITQPKNVRLAQLAPGAIHALAAGDLAAASQLAPVPLTPYFVDAECLGTWRMRSRQVRDDPDSQGWITAVIIDTDRQLAVGRAGYHGPPDGSGMVEVGYSVDPRYRRRGYARAALVALLDRARREPTVRTVRASISPDNIASRRLVEQYGFVEVGEQWDDEDGLERVFEVDAGSRS
jgi:[ribosomal protein S5]-alanine N-acetyltransferase